MLALAWPWDEARHNRTNTLAKRLAASLCAGIGGHASASEFGDLSVAYRPLRSTESKSRAWRPAILPGGKIVIFHGYFDNAAAIAADLGASADDAAHLYGLAVERWGGEADLRIIGEYCAVVAELDDCRLRLSRSPLRAPPLCYFHDEKLAAGASVPRAIFAAGVEQRLNESRVADSALLNFSDAEQTYFANVARVPTGCIVELNRGRARLLTKYYDPLALPEIRLSNAAEYIARAGELLDEGVRACLAGFRKPAVALSGGLDSPQVAVRAAAAMPGSARLPSFTFHPEERYDGLSDDGTIGDERPFVEAFAAMHPRIEPHFTANEGHEHDYRWNEFFHLMGGAPSGLCNMYVFHGLFSGAVKKGCDVLLLADWGNSTFSDKGIWGLVEYLITGRWRQLRLALARMPSSRRSMIGRLFAHSILPLLPDSMWHMVRALVFPKRPLLIDLLQPLSVEYRITSSAEKRLKSTGILAERNQPRSRRHALKLLFENDDFETGEIYQAFEQMYGVAQRDPTAYRPLVEFCFGLPTEMFLKDGEMRWLAKQMAKGIMPEEQRANRLNGRWDADWHLRIGRRRNQFLAEFDQISRDERIARMLDIPRLRAALEDWPDHTETDKYLYFSRELAVPRGLLTARFINYVEGRNQV